MKRLTLFATALFVAVSSFAAVSYELNGGVTNAQGWKTPQDMYATLNADWNAFSSTDKTWTSLADLQLTTDPVAKGIPTEASTIAAGFLSDANFILHFQWLIDYMTVKCTEAGVALPTDGAALRYNLAAFFVNGHRTGWPAGPDYSSTGVNNLESYQATWKGSFANPTEPTDSVALYAPYKEGFTFDGWYAAADFSGDKVTHVSAATTGTLYAKWVEYIPTIAEVIALADDATTKAQATVSFVQGSEFWIQDATAGIMCYQSNHGLAVGELVTLSATKVTYGGIPELKNITVENHEAGAPVAAQTVLLSDILADSAAKYTSELVKVEGVRVHYVTSGNYTNPYFYNGFDTIAGYKITLDQTAIPEGAKVNAVLVVSEYDGKKQFRGDAANVTVAASAGQDPYVYPAAEDAAGNKFSLVNNWLYSVNLENWNANRPNPVAEGSRSVLYKDGILYFSYRDANTPTSKPYMARVNAKTGEMLENVYFAENIFKAETGEWLFGPFSDMKMDNAGNVLVSNLPTGGGDFQVWSVDVATGAGTLVIDQTNNGGGLLKDLYPNATVALRIDRIGVYGDITKDAVIMAPISSGAEAFKWEISEGMWDYQASNIQLKMEGNLGTAPQICPIEDDYFYVDGFSTYPMLFDGLGNLVDDFSTEAAAKLTIGLGGKARAQGHNGVLEFEVNGDYYLIMAGDNTGGAAPSTFVLYKFKDENRAFAEMTQLYEFPYAGMGGVSNPQRTATPFAEVAADGKSVDLYVYTCENGYGSYTLYLGNAPETGLKNTSISNDVEVKKVIENGQVIIVKEGVRYNVLGAQL